VKTAWRACPARYQGFREAWGDLGEAGEKSDNTLTVGRFSGRRST